MSCEHKRIVDIGWPDGGTARFCHDCKMVTYHTEFDETTSGPTTLIEVYRAAARCAADLDSLGEPPPFPIDINAPCPADIRALRCEHAAWVDYNFPNAHPDEPLKGIVEEVGELMDVEIMAEGVLPDSWEDDQRDAIGDIQIYLLHYCLLHDFDPYKAYGEILKSQQVIGTDPMQGLVLSVGRLAHADLKLTQGIRQDENLKRAQYMATGWILTHLERYCNQAAIQMWNTIEHAWSEVRCRDWRRYPNSKGLPPKPKNT